MMGKGMGAAAPVFGQPQGIISWLEKQFGILEKALGLKSEDQPFGSSIIMIRHDYHLCALFCKIG